jgi:O-antigen/teichoic acid export membrane protein
LISPVILVRLLSVHEFGRYREFLLYAGVLISIAAFGVNSSLLRFVPDNPQGWRYVNQAVTLTFASSVLVAGSMLALNALVGGALVGEYATQVALYVFLFVNLDFWELLWLSEKRSYAVLGYSTGRLLARIAVVTTAAALTKNVDTVIWSLIGLETLRLATSAAGWWRRSRTAQTGLQSRWREQLRHCLPFGGALVLVTLNKSMGGLFVAKMLGPVALAHYAIGVYVAPVITVLRNSLSDVLLPEMVARNRDLQSDRLALWRRSTVVTMIALVGAGVVLAKFAEPLVETLFSAKYLPAAPIFQLYLLVFLRESIDFAVPLRAADRTTAILRSNLVAIVTNAALMLVMLPRWGVLGAVAAFLISRAVDGAYLGAQTMQAYAIPLAALASWKDLVKVLVSAAFASVVLIGSFWIEYMGIFGIALGGAAYLLAFFTLLALLRIPEVTTLLHYVRAAPTLVMRRLNRQDPAAP